MSDLARPLRAYAPVALDGQPLQLHYYHFSGPENYQGPALLVLHPSPLSARFMLPLCEMFAHYCPVYALDTPGYGASDPLPASCLQAGPDMAPYARTLLAYCESLGLTKPLVYGSATGAQIAIAAGRLTPSAFTGLLLENVAWLYPEEVAEFEQHYFPPLDATADGAHLRCAWQIASQLFTHFPWYKTDEAHRISDAPVPPAVVHDTALHYLQSGPHYAHAYRAAMANEHPDNLRALTLPTCILHWEGSLLRRYTGRLLDCDLGEAIALTTAGPEKANRAQYLQSLLRALLARR